MKISRMTVLGASSGTKTKAFFDVETDEGLVVKNFKIAEGPTGIFVAFPSQKGKDGNWRETVYCGAEMKKTISDMALNHYRSGDVMTGNRTV